MWVIKGIVIGITMGYRVIERLSVENVQWRPVRGHLRCSALIWGDLGRWKMLGSVLGNSVPYDPFKYKEPDPPFSQVYSKQHRSLNPSTPQ